MGSNFDPAGIILIIPTMFNFFFRYFNKCSHKKLMPFSAGSFCPDCGREVEITWLIPRCECCNTRRKAKVVFNSLHTEDKFCIKCGGSGFYTESKTELELFDVDYAIISKKEVGNGFEYKERLQVWVENANRTSEAIKLIPAFAGYN